MLQTGLNGYQLSRDSCRAQKVASMQPAPKEFRAYRNCSKDPGTDRLWAGTFPTPRYTWDQEA